MKNKIQLFDDVMIGLLFVVFLCALGWGAQFDYGQGFTTNMTTINTNSAAYDTINLRSSVDSTFTVAANFNFTKKGVRIRSYPGRRQTVSCYITGSVSTFVLYADSIILENIDFRYPAGTPSGTNYMVSSTSSSNKWEGFLIDGCNFINENSMQSGLRGCNIRIGHSGVGSTWRDCMWYRIYDGIGYSLISKTTYLTNVSIVRCLFYESNIIYGHKWTVEYTSFIGPSNQNDAADSCDTAIFRYDYFNQRSGSGEFISWEEKGTGLAWSKGNQIVGCIFDTNTHVYAIAKQDSLIIDSTIMKRNSGTNGTAYYVHDLTASNKNITIKNSILANCGAGATIDGTNVVTTPITDFLIRKCIILGSGALNISSGGTNNTIDSTWFQRTPTITNFTASDTLWNNGHTAYIDTGYHPFVKWYDNKPYVAGIGKIASITSIDTSDTGFAINLSVSTMLRHPNRPDTNNWMDSRIITGDSARFILKTSTDGVAWTPKDTIVLLASGSGALAATDLNRGTGYKYKIFVEGVSTSLYDTSASYNITTTGGGSVIRTIINKIRLSLDIGL